MNESECVIESTKEVLNDLLDTGAISTRRAYETICHLPYPDEIKAEIDKLFDERYENEQRYCDRR